MSAPILVTFSKPHGPYRPGDCLYLAPSDAAALVKAGVIEVPAEKGAK